MTKHPGAQAVYGGLLKIHDWIIEHREDGTVPEWVDDEVMNSLDLFVGWCAPQLSLKELITVDQG